VILTVVRRLWLLVVPLALLPELPPSASAHPASIHEASGGDGHDEGYERGRAADGTTDHGHDAELARRLVASGRILPLAHVIDQARVLSPGTLIDARLHWESGHDGYVYEVKMLDRAGAVLELEFDAATGLVIENERDGD